MLANHLVEYRIRGRTTCSNRSILKARIIPFRMKESVTFFLMLWFPIKICNPNRIPIIMSLMPLMKDKRYSKAAAILIKVGGAK
jgi:hypothetical protein